MDASSLDGRVAALAARQHGALSHRQAAELGATPAEIRHRRSSGRWLEPLPGVYVIAGTPDGTLRRLSVGVLARPGALVSHGSAARMHRVGLVPVGVPNLIGAHGQRPLPGYRFQRRRDHDRCRSVQLLGLPVTDLPTTLVDLATDLSRERYIRVVDDALSAHRLTIDQLVVAFERHAARGRTGIALAREVIGDRAAGEVVTASELEQRFRQAVVPLLRIAPIFQYLPPWRTEGIGRVDVAFPEQRLVVELDGRRWHSRDEQWEEDHRRDQEALVHGWRTVRFTYHQIRHEAVRAASVINAVLDLAVSELTPSVLGAPGVV